MMWFRKKEEPMTVTMSGLNERCFYNPSLDALYEVMKADAKAIRRKRDKPRADALRRLYQKRVNGRDE